MVLASISLSNSLHRCFCCISRPNADIFAKACPISTNGRSVGLGRTTKRAVKASQEPNCCCCNYPGPGLAWAAPAERRSDSGAMHRGDTETPGHESAGEWLRGAARRLLAMRRHETQASIGVQGWRVSFA